MGDTSMVVYPSHHKHMLCFEQTQALSSPLGSSFGCPKTMPFFSKKRNNREWPGNFRPGNKNWVPPPTRVCTWGADIPSRTQHPKKSDSRGETLGIYWGDLERLFCWIGCLPFLTPHSVSQNKVLSYSKWGWRGQPDCFPSPRKGLQRAPQWVTKFFSPKLLNFQVIELHYFVSPDFRI